MVNWSGCTAQWARITVAGKARPKAISSGKPAWAREERLPGKHQQHEQRQAADGDRRHPAGQREAPAGRQRLLTTPLGRFDPARSSRPRTPLSTGRGRGDKGDVSSKTGFWRHLESIPRPPNRTLAWRHGVPETPFSYTSPLSPLQLRGRPLEDDAEAVHLAVAGLAARGRAARRRGPPRRWTRAGRPRLLRRSMSSGPTGAAPVGAASSPRGRPGVEVEVRRGDLVTSGEHRTLHPVLQLADVAGPAMSDQLLLCIAVQLGGLPAFSCCRVGQEVPGQRQDVVGAQIERPARPARSTFNRIVQVLAEASLCDRLLQRGVGGADQPDIGAQRLAAAPAAGTRRSAPRAAA